MITKSRILPAIVLVIILLLISLGLIALALTMNPKGTVKNVSDASIITGNSFSTKMSHTPSGCSFTKLDKDSDGDGIADVCDNCFEIYNPYQEDLNNNWIGDACETREKGGEGSNESETICKSNSECGNDITRDRECSGKKVIQKSIVHECVDAGNANAYCKTREKTETIETCTGICLNGACNNIRCNTNEDCNDNNGHTEDLCMNSGSVNSSCMYKDIACLNNNECGNDFSSLFCSGKDIFKNSTSFTCNNAGKSSSSCSLNLDISKIQSCSKACLNGNCIACNQDSDCNDNNPSTIDKCLNPGTINSHCENNHVACNCNSDCGIDGFIGSPFCSGKNIFQNFVSNICNNAGTSNSFCSSSTSGKLKQSCTSACTNGACSACSIGQTRQCGTSNIGECKFGTESCTQAGNFGSCVGAINPTAETCDGKDNNCDGLIDNGNLCAQGEVCQQGSCKPIIPVCTSQCTAGAKRCALNGYQICADGDGDGCTEWSQATDCGFGKTCENGNCVPVIPTCTSQCSEGSQRCALNGYQVCHDGNADGCTEWSQATDCGFGKTCENGNCVPVIPTCTSQCTSGTRECELNGYRICADGDGDGCTEWSQATDCGYGKSCIGGTCI